MEQKDIMELPEGVRKEFEKWMHSRFAEGLYAELLTNPESEKVEALMLAIFSGGYATKHPSPAKAEQEGPVLMDEIKYIETLVDALLSVIPGGTMTANGIPLKFIKPRIIENWRILSNGFEALQTTIDSVDCILKEHSEKQSIAWNGQSREHLLSLLLSTTPPVKEAADPETAAKEASTLLLSAMKSAGLDNHIRIIANHEGIDYQLSFERVKEAGQPVLQVLQNITLADIDAPTFTHTAEFRKHFDYIKGKFIEVLKGEALQPVDGPWKFEHHFSETNDERGREFDEWTTITDGKVTLYLDQQEDEQGEQKLCNLLNQLKAKLDYDHEAELSCSILEDLNKEMANFIDDLQKAFDPDAPVGGWTIGDFLEAAKIKFEQPAPSGLRLTETQIRELAEKWFNDQLGLCVDATTRIDAGHHKEGYIGAFVHGYNCSPAPVQVDPLLFAEWIKEQNYKPYAGEWFLNGNNIVYPGCATVHLLEKYTQSLQNKP